MNSLSVVLAADSATTVEYYGENGPEKRYFKGANKIFQLSEKHPVGLMIYNSASLLGVPWEVTIKEFRRKLGDKSFNSVKGFADEFISFVHENQGFFPDEVRQNSFVELVSLQIIQLLNNLKETIGNDPDQNYDTLFSEMVSGFEFNIENLPLDATEISELETGTTLSIQDKVNRWLEYFDYDLSSTSKDGLAKIAFQQSLIKHSENNNYSGFVFAGFGDHSVFPELVSYSNCKL